MVTANTRSESFKSIVEMLDRARALKESGQASLATPLTNRAAELTQELLKGNPGDPSLINILGVVAYSKAELHQAAELFLRATQIDKAEAEYRVNLGIVRRELEDFYAAAACFTAALRLRPADVAVYARISEVLRRLGREGPAEVATHLAQQKNLGLRIDRSPSPATPSIAAATMGAFYYVLGIVASQAGDFEEACHCFEISVMHRPQSAPALSNWAAALLHLGNVEQALLIAERSVSIDPSFVAARTNLAKALLASDKVQAASEQFEHVLQLATDPLIVADAWRNLGSTLTRLGRWSDALSAYRAGVEARPDDPLSHLCLGTELLRNGDFATGWREFEWRLHPSLVQWHNTVSGAPNWNGEDLRGKSILLHTEFGFGDSIQFIRLATSLHERGASVYVQCETELQRLFETVSGIHVVYTKSELPPAHDYQCALLSLPHLLGLSEHSIPNTVPYVEGDPDTQRIWEQRLATQPAPRIGLAWAGDPKHGAFDRRRSMQLADLAPLATVKATFVSLQWGASDLGRAPEICGFQIVDSTAEWRDFADSAAIVQGLDLVITVDTSIAHLAGSLGKPVWLLCDFEADWRWLIGHTDSPWYPTMRIFRQPRPGDWSTVVNEVARSARGRENPLSGDREGTGRCYAV